MAFASSRNLGECMSEDMNRTIASCRSVKLSRKAAMTSSDFSDFSGVISSTAPDRPLTVRILRQATSSPNGAALRSTLGSPVGSLSCELHANLQGGIDTDIVPLIVVFQRAVHEMHFTVHSGRVSYVLQNGKPIADGPGQKTGNLIAAFLGFDVTSRPNASDLLHQACVYSNSLC